MVILATFAELEESEARAFKPKVVLVDAKNRMVARDVAEMAGPGQAGGGMTVFLWRC